VDFQPTRAGQQFSGREAAIADHQASPLFVTPLGVRSNEVFDLGIDGGLEHALSTRSNQFVQRWAFLELRPERQDLRIERWLLILANICWQGLRIFRRLLHGVFLSALVGR
jgi:hypothetical protein